MHRRYNGIAQAVTDAMAKTPTSSPWSLALAINGWGGDVQEICEGGPYIDLDTLIRVCQFLGLDAIELIRQETNHDSR